MAYWDNECNVSELQGKILVAVESDYDTINFYTSEDRTEGYRMYHAQDCCESVTIDDICGDLQDLVGSPIIVAEEVSGQTPVRDYSGESETYTFYKIDTAKGGVTIRWYGTSNGYYSESVNFRKL